MRRVTNGSTTVGRSAHTLRGSFRHESAASMLVDLAYNLRWSWDSPTRDLFRALAPRVWETTRNPVAVLRAVSRNPRSLTAHAYRTMSAHRELERYLARPARAIASPSVAYLCAEYALADCLPIYAGGLGVLAGDYLKAASDLGLPVVGVGLFYRYGYFQQVIDAECAQREHYRRLDANALPLRPVIGSDGAPLVVGIPFPGRTVYACVWCVQVGRVPLYLLDTDTPFNAEGDRGITARLYCSDAEVRLCQEMVLGIGGARLLSVLRPPLGAQLYHLNEGHSALLALELIRHWLDTGLASSFDEAATQVASRLIFTTHTPVAAGHDVFSPALVETYLGAYRQELGLNHEEFIGLGRRDPSSDWEGFCLTVLALRSAARRNAVSRLHGEVSRHMWAGVGVGRRDAAPAAPMAAVTNAVHTVTWVGPEIGRLFDRQLGVGWRQTPHDPRCWARLADLEPEELWCARTAQRGRLLLCLKARGWAAETSGLASGATEDNSLVLGFARRFTSYKRAALLLTDADRLARLLQGDQRGRLVLVFAGKAHPRDEAGKALVQRIVHAARDERFRGRLLFLEDYDVELARLLVQGCDVWLNTPRRPEEASGTSGMKAVLNGALHVSELDGWWDEAYEPGLGWALGSGLGDELRTDARDEAGAAQLMQLLETQVVPLFFARDADGRPSEWLRRVADSIRAFAPTFSAHRMVLEYIEHMYRPAACGDFPNSDGHHAWKPERRRS